MRFRCIVIFLVCMVLVDCYGAGAEENNAIVPFQSGSAISSRCLIYRENFNIPRCNHFILGSYKGLLEDTAPFFSIVRECMADANGKLRLYAQLIDIQLTDLLQEFVQGGLYSITPYFPILMSCLAYKNLAIVSFEDLMELPIEDLKIVRTYLKKVFFSMNNNIAKAQCFDDKDGERALLFFQNSIFMMYQFFDEIISERGFGYEKGIVR